jgi:hypothetical protein
MADNRPTVYFDPDIDSWVYRASGVGGCVKELVAIASGEYQEARKQEHQDLLDRTAAEGNLHESAVIDALVSSHGYQVVEQQTIVTIPVMRGVVIRGHTDGIIKKGARGKHRLLEVKSMSTKRFARWQSQGFSGFPKYAAQLSAYMEANPGLDVVYAVKRREDGFLALTDIKADKPPVPFSDIRKKILTAEGYRRKGTLPPACDIPASEQFFCPLWYLHDEVVSEATEPTEEMLAIIPELLTKRGMLSAVEKAGKEAEEERRALDKEILNLMGSDDRVIIPVEVDGEIVSFQITKVNGTSKWVDKDMLREELGEEQYARYEKVTRFQYPKVTEKKGQK